jgi:hypothetical protein
LNSYNIPYSLRHKPKTPEKIFSSLHPKNNKIMQSLRSHRQTALLGEHASTSLTLLRTPKYEFILTEEERGVAVDSGSDG